ncbi:phospholipase D/nuclease [Aspergillus coremiiformis]|uniref:Dol-P-Glc:Glc(2)Man(9)GlcNAc(2)-PP-Dol alpha-1,2-glucosyltransferase n=1 Tax=Aspergillus coremiiformis TaxID=138285 RepID=A0A5N6ZB53_9EURO|nr:phospholipase D/nuclease [Aspergillus coremiiformis]
MSAAHPQSGLALAARYAVPFVLLSIPIWMTRVNAVVPEPYLDEAFHVPQAQAYWHHKWTHWDPKITTPPGLYLWSYVLCACALFLRGAPMELSAEALRSTNVAAAAVFLPLRLQTLLDSLRKERNTRPSGAWLSHTVLNICLFPPIFFFSGLYYTDILALLVVIEAYNWDLKRSAPNASASQTLVFVLLGVSALSFRQTNIFWVAVFFGGLQVIRTLRKSSKTCQSTDVADIAKGGFKNELYDPHVSEASLADYFKTALSICAAALGNVVQVFVSSTAYIVILAAFGGFVLWNNGVVLGHKEFHTAGLHLPQMLYIWPYIFFFSWPILISPVVNVALPKVCLPKFIDYGFPKKQKGIPKIMAVLAIVPSMLAVVHYNTIVHPFTLADNRHYIFYVFRILLRTHPAVKYAAVVIYFLCGWAVISAFGFSTTTPPPRFIRAPQSAPASQPPVQKVVRGQNQNDGKKRPSKKAAQLPKTQQLTPEAFAKIQEAIKQRQVEQLDAPRVSFVLVWLAATSLSLVTAPLVEPRYFIIPWVMWRLHLPRQPTPLVYRDQRPRDENEALHAKIATNFPLFLETFWFLVLNAVTGYVFLYKGFEWPQEPGRIQRFMCVTMAANDHSPKRKRVKLLSDGQAETSNNSFKSAEESNHIQGLASLRRSITPPPQPQCLRRSQSHSLPPQPAKEANDSSQRLRVIPSPIQLTHIRDLAVSSGNNVDTIRLRDILGDPMIRECWQFNYLHDVDFIMSQFDEDVRRLVRVKVVHGSWKKDAPNRVSIDEACSRHPNVEAIVAYMPEAFGTHHSKMMVLLRHDDLAQIIIHTANMIPGDWVNMCQAVWRSPLLPLRKTDDLGGDPALGSGARFKRDLLAYLKEYGIRKTGSLVDQLMKYDFGAIRAALVASVPSKQKINDLNSQQKTLWGWPALKDVVRHIPPTHKRSKAGIPHIVTQISSVASLGQTDKWLKDVLFASLSPPSGPNQQSKYSIIFPTADEIRRSLNGYGSGGSIHMKLQSAAQQKQLQYMRPYLQQWAGDHDTVGPSHVPKRDAGRRRAAPHIKTYIRFSDAEKMDTIDWAMVTSANLSTQAWGAAVNATGEVRICSWEIGVVVWPQLYIEGTESATMVPSFKRDLPSPAEIPTDGDNDVVIGLRMPYDLPLTAYTTHDTPWCATAAHTEPDWLGQTWTLD